MRVLIVDDSPVMRRIVEGALRHSGLELTSVLQAANGLEALCVLERAAAESQPLELILCDVHMSILDGLGFLLERARRSLAPGVPVVMITADGTDPHLMRAVAAGAQGYISKPFTIEQMKSSILPLLGNLDDSVITDAGILAATLLREQSEARHNGSFRQLGFRGYGSKRKAAESLDSAAR